MHRELVVLSAFYVLRDGTVLKARTVVYINSPARSGSTFLQFMLSKHSNAKGLGELYRVLTDVKSDKAVNWSGINCSCGKSADVCEFWSTIVTNESDSKEMTSVDLASYFFSKYENCVLVDSSKNGDDMALYESAEDINSKIILLVRDYRGWSNSAMKYRYIHNDATFSNTSIVLNSYRWLISTVKRMHTISKLDADVLYVYYENLVFDLDAQLERIYDFVELEHEDSSSSLSTQNSHELYGNREMRSDKKKSSSVVYDHSWMSITRFSLYSIFIFPVGMFASYFAKISK